MRSIIGYHFSAISQVLPEMTRDRLIKSPGPRKIQLLDRKGLEELASGERKLA
jgi:hypothetical protein